MRIILNGKEITNPFVKGLAGLLAMLVFSFLLILLLPLIGIVVAISLGLVLTIFATMFSVVIILLIYSRWRISRHLQIENKRDRDVR